MFIFMQIDLILNLTLMLDILDFVFSAYSGYKKTNVKCLFLYVTVT